MRIRFVLQEIGIGLRRNMTMTIAVIISVAVSLTLFGVALLVRSQVSSMKDYWYGKIEVSIFLCNGPSSSLGCAGGAVTDPQKAQIRDDLAKITGPNQLVKQVYEEDQNQAYQHAMAQFKGTPIAEFLNPSQLQYSFRVKLNNPQQYALVADQFTNRQGVAQVQDQREVLKPLFAIFRVIQWSAIGIAAILLLVAVLLISNTMRVAAFSRRRETGIMRLVGASNFYIQLPFLAEGAVAGLIGAMFASACVVAVKGVLFDRALGNTFQALPPLGWSSVVTTVELLLLFGVLMSVVASFVTLRKYLRV